jgi:hypothetical protein
MKHFLQSLGSIAVGLALTLRTAVVTGARWGEPCGPSVGALTGPIITVTLAIPETQTRSPSGVATVARVSGC